MDTSNQKTQGARNSPTTTSGDVNVPSNPKVEKDLKTTGVDSLVRDLNDLKTGDKRIRLSGAARKRMKFLKKSGLTQEEARQKALVPMPPKKRVETDTSQKVSGDPCTSKRPYSAGSTPEVNPSKRAKRRPTAPSGTAGQRVDYSAAVSGIKMGIISQNYPDELLTTEQMSAVQDAILKEVRGLLHAQDAGSIQPKFQQAQHRPGWLALTCCDRQTADWLKNLGSKLSPCKGAQLRVVEDKDMPHPEILVGYLPASQGDSNESILELIEAQNDLKARSWKVLRRNPSGSSLELTVSVDTLTMRKLEANKLKVNYKFGFVQFRKRGKRGQGSASAETNDPSAMEVDAEKNEEGSSGTQEKGSTGNGTTSKEETHLATTPAPISCGIEEPNNKQ